MVKPYVVSAWESMTGGAIQPFRLMGDKVATVFNWIADVIRSVTPYIVQAVKTAINIIKNVWNDIKPGVQAVVQWLLERWNTVKSWFQSNGPGILDGLKQAWETIKPAVTAVVYLHPTNLGSAGRLLQRTRSHDPPSPDECMERDWNRDSNRHDCHLGDHAVCMAVCGDAHRFRLEQCQRGDSGSDRSDHLDHSDFLSSVHRELVGSLGWDPQSSEVSMATDLEWIPALAVWTIGQGRMLLREKPQRGTFTGSWSAIKGFSLPFGLRSSFCWTKSLERVEIHGVHTHEISRIGPERNLEQHQRGGGLRLEWIKRSPPLCGMR